MVYESLRKELLFHLQLCKLCPKRTIPLTLQSRKQFVLYTDASYGSVKRPDGSSVLRLGWVLLELATNFRCAWTCDVPQVVIADLPDQNTYISYGEAFAPFLAFIQHENLLRCSSIIVFIDNVGVLCSLVVGHSRVVDLSLPIYSTILRVAGLKATVWWEYVDSNANLSDGPSRDGISDPICKSLGIPVLQYDWPSIQGVPVPLKVLCGEIIGEISKLK